MLAIPAAEWPDIQWPHYGFGATMKIRANAQRYFITFVDGGSSLTTWAGALGHASQWRSRLHPGFSSSRVRHFIIWGFMLTSGIGVIAAFKPSLFQGKNEK